MKNSGIEWIGEIPDDWETFSLKQLTECHFGGCWGEDSQGDELDAVCIRIADFNFDNQTIKSTASTIRHYTMAQLNKGVLHDGDLIVEKSGGGEKTPVGRVVLFEKKLFPEKTTFANFSECLRLKSIVSGKYIAYYLKSLYYSYDMHYYFNQTTGLQNLDIDAYLSTKLCYPLLFIQQKIADYLDKKCAAVDRLIENQRAQIEKLKEYKQSVITEAVTRGLDPSAPLKDSGVEWLGKIPTDFLIQNVRSLFRIRKEIIGREPETVLSITQSGLKIKNILENEGQMANSYANYQIVHIGDFAMNHMDLLTGGIGVSQYEGVTSPDYRVFEIKEVRYIKKYFLYVFETYYRNKIFYAFGQGAANLGRWRLPAQNFYSIFIPVPPLEEQQQIADYLDKKCAEIDKLIAIKQQKIETLTEYKKSLIYEYVTGKKEVVS